ncbi:MAG: redoxin domain-containing protein [Thermoplasmata archaeon]|nr:redoxin domain-containing protein [Candidatus Sysuiplasma acidicola]
MNDMKPLMSGTKAPDFTLTSPDGVIVNLNAVLASGPAVITLIPNIAHADATQLIDNFRDDFNEFTALKANVIVILDAGKEEVRRLHDEHELQYPIFPDNNREVFRKFRAMDGIIAKKPRKYVCVVNREGMITKAFRSVDANKLSRQSLYALRDQMGRSALSNKK